MKLQNALKLSLDELRMQMLGVQVLFGFQFQGLFQDGFQALSPSSRWVDGAGMACMIAALTLLIAVPSQHRIVEGGEVTRRIYLVSRKYATNALFPLAAGIGCDLYVATRDQFGLAIGAGFAVLAAVVAMTMWYGLGLGLRRKWHIRGLEIAMERTQTPLYVKLEQMLTEARVILPGAQALLGFQLVVMMTKAFDQLPMTVRMVHLVALASLVLAIILLIAPAAIHRVAFGGAEDPRLHSLGSVIITIALFPLAAGISCDLWVALTRLLGDGAAVLAAAVASFVLLVTFWYLFPLLIRTRDSQRANHTPRHATTSTGARVRRPWPKSVFPF
jgi:hypothetical protein